MKFSDFCMICVLIMLALTFVAFWLRNGFAAILGFCAFCGWLLGGAVSHKEESK